MSLPSIQRVLLQSVAESDPEGRFVDVDNIQAYYKIAIPQYHKNLLQNQQQLPYEPHKPVILCLHHILGNQYTWRFHMQPLAEATGCHVISYDRVSFGFTERPVQWEEGKNPYTQMASVDFAVQLLIQLGYGAKKVVLIGVSAGASISCYIAIKYPHLVHSLILLGPALRPEDQGPPSMSCHILGTAPGRLFLKAALYQYLPMPKLYHDINAVPDFETMVRPCYRVPLTLPNFYEAIAWLFKYFIPLEVLPNKHIFLQFPILYLVGDDDKFTNESIHKEIFEEMLVDAPENAKLEYHVLKYCGHLPQEEKPQEVLDVLIDFLKRLNV
ncbi:19416_t:CDS:2 [Dentiscutata erythropus]|uniref:19416_t:CDS:1 n=1 Tax=Dentiscutata erythropus TaxID=1348616 RepID=A0A9N9A1R2_9GLOM|nr:19416_t:CDS:2 [Dentiscutata erythropus]